MRFLKAYGIAVVLLLIVAGWMLSGTFIQGGKGPGLGERPMIEVFTGEDGTATAETSSADVEPNVKLQSVRTQTFLAEAFELKVPLRGRIQADAVVSVRPETAGVVEAVHVAKGDRVNPGDLLCSIEQGTREARVAQAKSSLAQAHAALSQADADFETNKTLRERGVASANSARNFEVALTAAQASVQAAIAAVDDAENDLAHTQVHTEISGIVQEPLANIGDLTSANSVCATVVQLDQVRFVGRVAEAKISNVQKGMKATINAVTGQTVEGVVSFIAASANAATRSFDVEIVIDNTSGALRDGITADAEITIGVMPAHILPQSVLTLDNDGTIGVQTIVGDTTTFQPVTIVGSTTRGVWIAGLPPSIDIVILGQEYLVDGQKVAATNVSAGEIKS